MAYEMEEMQMQTTLDRLPVKGQAVVTGIDVSPALKSRLSDFGMIPGTRVCCCYRTPGGQVTALALRGTVIALRTGDMKKIRVQCL